MESGQVGDRHYKSSRGLGRRGRETGLHLVAVSWAQWEPWGGGTTDVRLSTSCSSLEQPACETCCD